MADGTCARSDCDRPVLCKGVCKKHYMEDRAERLRAEQCITEGCANPRGSTGGYCPACYQRVKAYGDPLAGPPRRKRRRVTVPTGTTSDYHKNHREVRKARGPAWSHSCEHCAGQAQTWAMKHESDGSSPEDYMPLCWPCHAKYDDFAARLPGNTGRKYGSEHRANISAALLRYHATPEAKEKDHQMALAREAAKRAKRAAGRQELPLD